MDLRAGKHNNASPGILTLKLGYRIKRKDFVARTLSDLTNTLERTVFADLYSSEPGLLQKLDPRTKIITFFVLILGASLTHHIETLLGLYLLSLVLATLSRIPTGFFIKRVWIFIPIFTGIIVLPAMFNFITPGDPVLVFATFRHAPGIGPVHLPKEIYITKQGLSGAILLVARVATSASFAILLLLTTGWTRLLKAMAALRLPKVFILILGMTYRYIFLLLRLAENMFLARRSRTVGRTNTREKQRWISSRLAFLMGRSYHLSNEVYLAMLSRGWNGQVQILDDFSLGPKDVLWAAFVSGVIIIAIFLEFAWR